MKYIGLKEDIGNILEKIRKQEHPLASLNKFGNYIIAHYLLDNFANKLTKKQIEKLEVNVKT